MGHLQNNNAPAPAVIASSISSGSPAAPWRRKRRRNENNVIISSSNNIREAAFMTALKLSLALALVFFGAKAAIVTVGEEKQLAPLDGSSRNPLGGGEEDSEGEVVLDRAAAAEQNGDELVDGLTRDSNNRTTSENHVETGSSAAGSGKSGRHLLSNGPRLHADRNRNQLLFYTEAGGPRTQAHISRPSWERYQRYQEETCRESGNEEYLAERPLNNTAGPYFYWEEGEFHRALRRRILLPDGSSGDPRILIESPLLRLDPRLLQSEPTSLCRAKQPNSEAEERQKLAKEEMHMFEDFLINKVIVPPRFRPLGRRKNGTMKEEVKSR